MKIYTKTGDAGKTDLLGGPRVDKDDLRIEAFGNVDELNAVLGVVRAEPLPDELQAPLAQIQHQLFNLGAELATRDPAARAGERIAAEHIASQEELIDHLESQLAPLKAFILPGGGRAAALLHLARCVCRRAERSIVRLGRDEPLRPEPLTYLNRLSDLLFVMARAANQAENLPDVPWQKGT